MAAIWLVCVLGFAFALIQGTSSESPSPTSCPHDHEIDDECLPGGKGFKTCQLEGNYYTFEVVKCKMPKSKCDCVSGYLSGLSDWIPKKCTCIDLTGRPSFPSTGNVTWQGEEAYQEKTWMGTLKENKPRAKVHGEIYRDDAGQFLLKYTSVGNWRGNGYGNEPAVMNEHLKIILPKEDGTFTKITRLNDDECKEETVFDGEESFNFLWDHVISGTWNADHYKKISEEPSNKGEPLKTQRWGGSYSYEDPMDSYKVNWDFYVDYNMRKGFALPKRFYKKVEEYDVEFYVTEIEYEYRSLDGIKQIKLEDYCP